MTNTTAARLPDAAITTAYVGRLWQDGVAWLTMHSLEILIASVIGAAIVALLYGARAIGLRICRDDLGVSHWRTVFARALARTRLWFMIAVAAKLVQGYAVTPAAVSTTVGFFFTVASVIQAALWAREIILGVIEHRAGGAGDDSTLGSALGIIRLLVTVALCGIAAILILDNLGVNVTGLVAGLGVGGIAIGLAAQGIFSDLFAALSILFDKPFRRGDSVSWDQTTGSVEAIGLKSTRVRSITGEEVVISNTNLLNKELRNFARLDRRRHKLVLGIVYQTSPETCAQIPEMIRAIVERQDKCSLVRCGMIGFGASSLDFELDFDVRSEQYEEVFMARSEVCIAILRAFNEAGIEFAYPTQTSYTAAPDGTFVLPYADVTVVRNENPVD